jgi:hypothetical protein
MSKLKKIGTGIVIIVLFLALITIISQPTPVQSQTIQIAKGSTPVGNTAWQQYTSVANAFGGEGFFVDVDTSSAKFTTTPMYITSLGGTDSHWATTGATSIYAPTPTGFRVYIRFPNGGLLTPSVANQYGWHINWIAVPI